MTGTTQPRSAGRALRSLALAGGAALTVTGLVAGCRDHQRLDDYMALTLSDPERRHPIHFSTRGEALLIEAPPGAEGLSPNQEVDVHRFIERYKAESTGTIRLSSPRAPRQHLAASRALHQVREMIDLAGVRPSAVVLARHAPEARMGSALTLAYERPVAVPPACSDWSEDLGRNHERVHYPNFGCATRRNLAATVANPRDLMGPQAEDARSSERRSVSWTQYTAPAGAGGSGGQAGAGAGAGDNKATPLKK